MNETATLLSQRQYRHALVRLCVLAKDVSVLTKWENLATNSSRLSPTKQVFSDGLNTEADLALAALESQPLALLQALDEFVAAASALSQPSLRDALTPESAFEVNGQTYWLLPLMLGNRRATSASRQPGHLEAWLHHHSVIPCNAGGIEVAIQVAQGALDDALHRLWDASPNPEFKVWIAHFNDGADVVGTPSDGTALWRASHVAPANIREQSVIQTLQAAQAAGVHAVVFPEFTLDPPLRTALIRHLRRNPGASPLLVQSGSFHEAVEPGGPFYNLAHLLDSNGVELIQHRKLVRFGTVTDGGVAAEDIQVGKALQVLATPIGAFAVLICKDFIDIDIRIRGLLQQVPVEWVLVPSFGDEKTIRAHQIRAKELAQIATGAHVVVAQTLNTAVPRSTPPSECVRGFGHVGGSDVPTQPVDEAGGCVAFALRSSSPKTSVAPRKPMLKRVK